MFTVVLLGLTLGFLVLSVLALSGNRTVVPPEGDYYLQPPGEPPMLAQLDLAQFEGLCLRLVEAMGLRVKSHARSLPGEIDIAAVSPDPITGGTYVVQGLKTSPGEVVDASRVLALAGAVKGEQAVKGILITTGFFAEDAGQPVEGPPIELINGMRLLDLARKHGVWPVAPA